MVTDYHGFFLYVPNYRIIEFFFFTRNVTDYHGFSLSRIIELSNFSFSHGVPRIITVLSLCPELSNYRIFLFHTEFHGESRIYISCHELSNYRISFHTEFHGESRIYISCPELSNYRISFHTECHGESRIYFFCHEFANSKIRDKEKHP